MGIFSFKSCVLTLDKCAHTFTYTDTSACSEWGKYYKMKFIP